MSVDAKLFLGVQLPRNFSIPGGARVQCFQKISDKKEEDMRALMLERPPFFFVERAIAVEANGKITVWGVAPMSEERSAGHFPEKPIVPLIELCKAMAQTGLIVAALKGEGRVPIAIGSGDSRAIARELIPAPMTALIKASLVEPPASLRLKVVFAGKKARRLLQKIHFVDAVAYKDGEPIGTLETIRYILVPKQRILR